MPKFLFEIRTSAFYQGLLLHWGWGNHMLVAWWCAIVLLTIVEKLSQYGTAPLGAVISHTCYACRHREVCSNILWDVVRDGLVPGMVLLAHTFDLRKMLPDRHPLPGLIKQQTAEWQERYETEAKDGLETSASSNNHHNCEQHETCSHCGNIRLKVRAAAQSCMHCIVLSSTWCTLQILLLKLLEQFVPSGSSSRGPVCCHAGYHEGMHAVQQGYVLQCTMHDKACCPA